MRLVVLRNDAMVADVACGKEAVYIGSSGGCRVRLDHAQIPEKQAVVYPEGDGTWWISPLDLTVATTINGALITKTSEVKADDEVAIADFVIRVFPEHEEGPAARVALGTSRAQLERFARATFPPGTVLKKPDEELVLRPEQLQPISRAATRIAAADTVEEFIEITLQTLLETFGAQRAWIGVRRGKVGVLDYIEGRTITGQLLELPELGEHLKTRVLDRAQFALVPRISRTERTSILAGPLIGNDGCLGMVYLDNGATARRYDQPDLDFLMLLLYIVAHQLEQVFGGLARNKAAMIEGQVSVAHEIQARMTPRKLPQWKQLQCGAFREPGRARTGDIYDVVRLANDLAAFMIAQTPATGAMPSMLIAQAQSAFRVAVMHQDTPAVFLRTLNWLLYDGQEDHPLSCLAAVIDPPSGQMRYAVAGDLGAFIIGKRGEPRRLGPREPATPLGLSRSTVYPLLPEQLDPKETLVLFTQGVTTAKNGAGETFGETRFVNLLCDGFGQQASVLLKEMLSDLRSFTEGGAQPDDITVILAHRL